MRRILLLVLAVLLMRGGMAQAATWTDGGADHEFSTPNNWSDVAAPASGSTQDIGGNYTVERSVDSTAGRTFVDGGAILNITGGTHSDDMSGASRWNFIGAGSAGAVNQSAGSYNIGHGLRIGTGSNGSSDGEYKLTSGSLTVSRGANSSIEPTNPGGRPSLEVGGTAGTALFEIGGGSLATRAGVHIGQTGIFSILGSAATSIGIGSNQSADGNWIQKTGGTLKVGVDVVGVTKVLIDDVDAAANQFVLFEAGSLLDVDYYNTGSGGGTWTVMELENGTITNNGLAFATGVDTGLWSFVIDNTGANGLLTITATGAPPVRVTDVTWDGSESSDWWNPLNWDNGTGVIDGDTAFFDFGPIDFSSGTSANLNAAKIKAGTMNISGGSFKATKHANRESWVGDTSGTSGIINQTGGDVDINALEVGRASGSAGFYNLSNGEFNIGRGVGGNSLYLGGNRGGNNAGDGTFTISGGSFSTRTGVKLGDDTSMGSGTFIVLGSAPSLVGVGTSGTTLDGVWLQNAGSRLQVGIDLGGLTKIFVDDQSEGKVAATFEAGSLLDVDYYNGGYGGGTWTVMEVENGTITDNGLALAPGVDTGIWSFNIDNSGANGKLTVSATGDPAPPQLDVTLAVGDTRKQMMRYGLDYERLWFWNSTAVANSAEIADWSVNDCNIDYIRTAVNGRYELEETNFYSRAYTDKIIPMMTAMQNANPNIKWFASPRPQDEAQKYYLDENGEVILEWDADNEEWVKAKVAWQPYPFWITGDPGDNTPTSFDFDDIKCSEYLIRYLLLMKSYGFKITYLDITNEWQSNGYGGRITQSDVRDIAAEFDAYLAAPWSHPEIPGLVLTADDIPLLVGPSSWNYSQGTSWINNLDTQAKKDAIDIASSHNTDRTGTAQAFADAAKASLGSDVEVWETEQHGWKSTSGENEVTSFYYYLESIRAGFSGINGWLAIGTPNQGHSYLLNENGAVVRNVKYHIFKKLSNTSNYGYALDIDQPAEFSATAALIRENVLTVWVVNTTPTEQVAGFDLGSLVIGTSDIQMTRWNEGLSVEGISDSIFATSNNFFYAGIAGESVYCFEVPLVDMEDNFPFVQAENYTTASGVTIPSDYAAFASAGSEISFDLDIVKTYPHDVAFRVSSASANIAFDIYDGTELIGSVDRMATGGAGNWTTIYQTLHLDGGPMELRIVATGGDWNLDWIQFDKEFFQLTSELENLALGLSTHAYSASNVHSAGHEADKAFDGDRSSRWATATSPVWVEVDFGTPISINGVSFYEEYQRTTSYEVQYFDGVWKIAYTGGDPENDVLYSFPTVTGSKFRYQSLTSSGNVTINELGLYYNPYYTESDPAIASMAFGTGGLELSWEGVMGSTYALQRSTNLVDGFTTIESGIPVHEEANMNTVATPDDAAFYRIILE